MFSKPNTVFQIILTRNASIDWKNLRWLMLGVGFSDDLSRLETTHVGSSWWAVKAVPNQSSEKEQMDRRKTSLSIGG